MASKGQEKPLIDTYSQRWDQRDKWIVAIAALCASLQSPKRYVDAHVTRDLFDFEVDAQPLDPVQDVSKLPKDVEKLKLEDDAGSSSYRARPDRAGELSTEDEAAVQAEVTSMKREGQVEAERESARRKRARTWLEGICERLDIQPHNLPSDPSTQDARELGAQLGQKLWPEVIHDLILFSLSIEDSDETTPGHSHTAQKAVKSEAQKKAQNAFTFSALDRKLVFQTAAILGIPKLDVYMSEKVLGQEVGPFLALHRPMR